MADACGKKYLSGNQLKYLPPGLFANSLNLSISELMDNPLSLDTRLCMLVEPVDFTQLVNASKNVTDYITKLNASYCSSSCVNIPQEQPTACSDGQRCVGVVSNFSCVVKTCSIRVPVNGNMSPRQPAINYNESVRYSCNAGYVLVGAESAACTDTSLLSHSIPTCKVLDVNECASGMHRCDKNAVCTSLNSTHVTCNCSTGYTGNGTTCSAIGGFCPELIVTNMDLSVASRSQNTLGQQIKLACAPHFQVILGTLQTSAYTCAEKNATGVWLGDAVCGSSVETSNVPANPVGVIMGVIAGVFILFIGVGVLMQGQGALTNPTSTVDAQKEESDVNRSVSERRRRRSSALPMLAMQQMSPVDHE
ncbi:E-selectin-like [Sycon ciliatum]|uniref:E-selectin-like n=1 Tax=Sycon ciliatum TaxID=27933 RepID=UPI0031F689DA